MANEVSIWDKVSYEIELARDDEGEESGPRVRFEPPNWLQDWNRKRRYIDLIATLLWLYAFTKAFVGDFDRELVESVFPDAQWVVDLRFFLFLALLALAVLLVRPRSLMQVVIYIAVFPLVVLFWKLPKAVLKTKSWVAFFGVANAVAATVSSLKYTVLAAAAVLFAILLVTVSETDWVLEFAAVLIGGALAVSFGRTIRFSLAPSRFLRVQEKGIQRITNSNNFKQLMEVNEELRSDEIQQFDEEQQTQFVNNVGASVIAHRTLYLWAYQLDRYRRSPIPFAFNALAFFGLLVQTIVGLTLINYAIYKADPGAFSYATDPSVWVFARYSFASLYGNEIAAVQAQSDLTNLVALLGLLAGFLLVAGLLLAVVVNRRSETQDAAARETIVRIKAQGDRIADLHRREFNISIEEAAQRLLELKYALMGVVEFLNTQIPSNFRFPDGSEPPSSSTRPD